MSSAFSMIKCFPRRDPDGTARSDCRDAGRPGGAREVFLGRQSVLAVPWSLWFCQFDLARTPHDDREEIFAFTHSRTELATHWHWYVCGPPDVCVFVFCWSWILRAKPGKVV